MDESADLAINAFKRQALELLEKLQGYTRAITQRTTAQDQELNQLRVECSDSLERYEALDLSLVEPLVSTAYADCKNKPLLEEGPAFRNIRDSAIAVLEKRDVGEWAGDDASEWHEYFEYSWNDLRLAILHEWWLVRCALRGESTTSSRPSVAQLSDGLDVVAAVVSGFPEHEVELRDPPELTWYINAVWIEYKSVLATRQIALLAKAYGFSCAAEELLSTYQGESCQYSWSIASGDSRGCSETVEAVDKLRLELEVLTFRGHTHVPQLPAETGQERDGFHAFGETPRKSASILDSLATIVAGRLNETDRNILEAVGDFADRGVSAPTQDSIAEKAGGTRQRTREMVGAMIRHGLIDRGDDGKGFVLSDLGQRVATLIATSVASD